MRLRGPLLVAPRDDRLAVAARAVGSIWRRLRLPAVTTGTVPIEHMLLARIALTVRADGGEGTTIARVDLAQAREQNGRYTCRRAAEPGWHVMVRCAQR